MSMDKNKEGLVQACFMRLKGLNDGRGQFNEVRQGLQRMEYGELQSLNQLLLSAEQTSQDRKRHV